MTERLKIGIIGCGEIATRTAQAIADARNAVIGMVMDLREALARDLGTKYGVPYTSRLDKLLSSDIDAVYIATPHDTHAPLAVKAARAGKHVLVEKPIATTIDDAHKMIEECRRNGVKLSVCFIHRYNPIIQEARRLVKANAIGEVISIHTWTLIDKPEAYWRGGYTGRVKDDWRMHKDRAGGGILIMNIVHNVDYLRYITGLEAVRIYSEYGTLATHAEVEDSIVVTIRYSNGALGSIVAHSCARGGIGPLNPGRDRILGVKGQIILSNPLLVYVTEKVRGCDLRVNTWNKVPLRKTNPRRRYVEETARAILADEKPPISGEDGLKALEIILAAYKAGRLHKPISLPLG